jgi:hypothetical protein
MPARRPIAFSRLVVTKHRIPDTRARSKSGPFAVAAVVVAVSAIVHAIEPAKASNAMMSARAPSQSAPSDQRAEPVDAHMAILNLFRTHAIVALGEGLHGNEQAHAFRLTLIRDPRFAASVDDIVVECGSARYQDVIDRFVEGQDVPYATLRHVWEDTTQAHTVWDRPIYEELFRTVREVNAALSQGHHIRVLLGDPPVDWNAVIAGTGDTGARERDSYAAGVVRREVIAKHHRALIVYGGAHLFRAGESLVSRIERDGAPVFTIATVMSDADYALLNKLVPDLASWPLPALAMIRGTVLDQEQFVYRDAVLYMGPPAKITFSRLTSGLCQDAAYMQMRVRRMLAVHDQRGVDELNTDCAGR